MNANVVGLSNALKWVRAIASFWPVYPVDRSNPDFSSTRIFDKWIGFSPAPTSALEKKLDEPFFCLKPQGIRIFPPALSIEPIQGSIAPPSKNRIRDQAKVRRMNRGKKDLLISGRIRSFLPHHPKNRAISSAFPSWSGGTGITMSYGDRMIHISWMNEKTITGGFPEDSFLRVTPFILIRKERKG